LAEQTDFVELVGKHLKYIYSQLEAFSKAISDLKEHTKDQSDGLTRVNDELRTRVESLTTELSKVMTSFEAKLAEETERLEKDLEVLRTIAAKDSELKELKTKMEAEVNSLREIALLRSEFEEFVKKFAQSAGEQLPPIPPPAEKPQEAQT